MIHVGNSTESQLEELLTRKERKWILDFGSINPYGLNQDDGFYCKNKRYRNRYRPVMAVAPLAVLSNDLVVTADSHVTQTAAAY